MSTKAEQCEWRGWGPGSGGERGALPGLPPPWWASREQPGGEVFFFIWGGCCLSGSFLATMLARRGRCAGPRPPAATGPGGNRCEAAAGRPAMSRAGLGACRRDTAPSDGPRLAALRPAGSSGLREESLRSYKPVLNCSKEEDACVLSFRACCLFTVMDGGAVQVLHGCWFVAVGMRFWPRK